MQISNLPKAELCRQLLYLSNVIGGLQPTEETIENIADNLCRYHGFTDEMDLKKAVEFALNSITEVQGRPSLSVSFLAKCVNAYKNHRRAEGGQAAEEYAPASTLTEAEKNAEILEGLIGRIEKFDEHGENYIPVFYHRWLVRMGCDPIEYCPKDWKWYAERAEHLDTNKRPLFAENVYKFETQTISDTEAKRLVLWDFFRHCKNMKANLKELVKL